jgi:hypothetical protein
MNVRFADRSIRFRILNEEIKTLLSGKALALEVPLGGSRSFRASISAVHIGSWQLDSDPTGLWLRVPQSALAEFAESLPSKSGLEHEFTTNAGAVQVALEVDVKMRRSG